MGRAGVSPRRGRREQPRGRVSTTWRKVSGREDLERAIDERYEPYGYESNAKHVLWITVGMVLWILLLVGLVFSDRATASMLSRWEADGFTAVPPESLHPDDLFPFAEEQGLACTSSEDVVAFTPDCERVLAFRSQSVSAGDRTSWFMLVLVLLLLVLAFIFSLFVHRASRNLLPLKTEGQRFTPEWAVACFYIPVINLFRPFQVFIELFGGSRSYRPGEDPQAWKGSLPPVVVVFWWMALLASVGLNPIVLRFVLANETLAEARSATLTHAWVDAWLIVPAIMAILVVHALHRRQEARFAAVGPHTVTRPRPEPEF